ncbi:hypothetical protein FRC07_007765 [Ceratobasidium sp. 392]|nr:hypothetical protein FRC07_007765 [Ceratobasidium sp. 392]
MKLCQSFIAASFVSSSVLARKFCTASQECWPSSSVWSSFNASVGGRLVAPRPPAWPCHDPDYDEAACQNVKANWNNSFWRANQTGAMENPVWESPGCSVDTPRNVTCEQGFVPTYTVVAKNADDVSKSVVFAVNYRLRLVVKNTGHDYLGRSSAEGSFSTWTHQLKGMNFTDSFVPRGCSKRISGVPAVTLGAGEQWRGESYVYEAVDKRNMTIVGGAANSVGASGGWVQGGGHSPLGFLYGMGVDNIRGYAVWTPPATLSLVVFHPNSPSVEHTNQTLAPIWEWVANHTDTQVASTGSIHSTFLEFFKVWIATDVSIAVPLWISGKLVSRKAMETRASDLAKLISTAVAYTPSLNFVGGGAVSRANPESTALNPQWRNDALISWNMGSTWNDSTPTETIETIKTTITNYTQALGELAGLDHAAYFNEADPQEPLWKQAFFGKHYERLLKIKCDVDPKGLFSCNRCVGSDS